MFKIGYNHPFALFKNSLPTFLGSLFQTSIMFICFENLFELLQPTYGAMSIPLDSVKFVTALIASFIGAAMSYPVSVIVRDMVEIYPKKVREGIVANNYRLAFREVWNYELHSSLFAGMGPYMLKNMPWMFLTIWISESLGMFKGNR